MKFDNVEGKSQVENNFLVESNFTCSHQPLFRYDPALFDWNAIFLFM